MAPKRTFERLSYGLSFALYFSGFLFLRNAFMARHDMLQVITELSSSMGPQIIDLNGFRYNLNLGTPSWVISEFLFGQDPLLLFFTQALKAFGFGPELTYILFLVLIQLFNCLFLLLTLRLLSKAPLHFHVFLSSTFFASSNLFSLMTQGHGEIFLFRYLAGFVFAYSWFLKSPSGKKLALVVLFSILQVSGYQSLYSIIASILFVLAQKMTYLRLRDIYQIVKTHVILSFCLLMSLVIAVVPLWFAFQLVIEDLLPSVRQSTGGYRGAFAGYWLFPEIVHGGIYVPLSLLVTGVLAKLLFTSKKLRNRNNSNSDFSHPQIFLLIPIAGCVIFSSLTLGTQSNSLRNLSLEAKTLFGLRNYGFLESGATYFIYLFCLVWIARFLELRSLSHIKQIQERVRAGESKNRRSKSKRRFGLVVILITTEICLFAYNQPLTFGSKGRTLEWAQKDEFQVLPYKDLEYGWLPYYPFTYSTGIFEKSAMFVPKEATFETAEERLWCVSCDPESSINVPSLTQYYSTWGRSKKIGLHELFQGKTIHGIQALKVFDQAYKSSGFIFEDRLDGRTVSREFWNRKQIDPIIKLNRGGVPNRILFIDAGLDGFLKNSGNYTKKAEFFSFLMKHPVFFYYESRVGRESLIKESKLEYLGQNINGHGEKVRLTHIDCSAEVEFQHMKFLVTTRGECQGIGLGLRMVDSPQWHIYSNRDVESKALVKKPYLNFLLAVDQISGDSMSYEIKYENTPYLVASLARLTMQILWFAVFTIFLIRHLKRSRVTLKETVL